MLKIKGVIVFPSNKKLKESMIEPVKLGMARYVKSEGRYYWNTIGNEIEPCTDGNKDDKTVFFPEALIKGKYRAIIKMMEEAIAGDYLGFTYPSLEEGKKRTCEERDNSSIKAFACFGKEKSLTKSYKAILDVSGYEPNERNIELFTLTPDEWSNIFGGYHDETLIDMLSHMGERLYRNLIFKTTNCKTQVTENSLCRTNRHQELDAIVRLNLEDAAKNLNKRLKDLEIDHSSKINRRPMKSIMETLCVHMRNSALLLHIHHKSRDPDNDMSALEKLNKGIKDWCDNTQSGQIHMEEHNGDMSIQSLFHNRYVDELNELLSRHNIKIEFGKSIAGDDCISGTYQFGKNI